ncbi:MAG: hypothetical protein ACR65R_07625 [Methylomicrobium sp.]
MHCLTALFCLLLSLPLRAEEGVDPILDGMTSGSITFIGESHKHVESAMLVKDLVTVAIERGQCPVLALEIADSQQPAIDRVLDQGYPVSAIDIPASIDHLPLRALITHLATLRTRSSCLSIVAIDAGPDNPNDRDEWMATRLSKLAGDRPILVLIGALHTLKKVDWLVKSGKPSVAERLAAKGFRVRSFPQRWIPDHCRAGENRNQRFISTDMPEALTILNDSLMSLINAKPHESTRGVVDGFILWKCDSRSRLEIKNLTHSN